MVQITLGYQMVPRAHITMMPMQGQPYQQVQDYHITAEQRVFSLNSELSGLSNVSSSAPTSGQVLKWNGSAWAPAADVDTDTVYTTFTSDFDTRLATKSTANLSEDASNKYFTDARARSAISVSGDLTYNSTTGVISYSEPTMYANSDVDSHLNSGSATSGQILSWTGTDYDWILNDNNTPPWADISSKPTTIAGFGITDAFDGAFSSLTGKPTTIAGYRNYRCSYS